MKTDILLEGNFLDLDQDVQVEVTRSIDDVREIGARESGFTKTIKLQGTAQNNFVFGHIFDVNVFNTHDGNLPNVGYNYNAAKNADCTIYVDGLEVIRGAARVLEITVLNGRVEYQLGVVGELGGLVLAIGDRELAALDFSEHDHEYSEANISGSWTAPAGAGYYYPLIDYGYTTDGINYPIGSIRPALYVREYLDKIIKGAGYTWESAFFDQDHFKRLIIPNNKDGNYTSPQYSFYRKRNTTLTVTGTSTVTYDESVGVQLLADISGEITSGRGTFSQKYQVETVVRLTGAPGTINYAIRLVRTSATLGNATYVIYAQNAGYFANQVIPITAGAIIELANGDSVRVEVVKTGGSLTLALDYVYFYGVGTPTLKIPVDIGDTMYMAENIPVGVKQRDFLLAITRMFNLYIVEDPIIPRRLKFTPYPEFYSPVADAVDWTAKVDHGQEISIKPLGELTSRYYDFRYKTDSDYYNDLYQKKYGRPYGTRVYDSGVQFLEQTQKIEVIFAPTPTVNVQNAGRLVPAIFKINGTATEQVGSVPRILYRSQAPVSCGTWYIKDGATTVGTYTTYPYAGHLDRAVVSENELEALDLNWGAPETLYFSIGAYPVRNLFYEYWARYVADISDKDSKLVSVFLQLKPDDINTLDFSRLVWIAGQAFRINKMVDYSNTEQKPTKMELLNVIYG